MRKQRLPYLALLAFRPVSLSAATLSCLPIAFLTMMGKATLSDASHPYAGFAVQRNLTRMRAPASTKASQNIQEEDADLSGTTKKDKQAHTTHSRAACGRIFLRLLSRTYRWTCLAHLGADASASVRREATSASESAPCSSSLMGSTESFL